MTRRHFAASLPRTRLRKGTTVVELPLVLWVVFILIALPLIVLATTSIRYSFLLNAAREAVHAAAQCKSFQQDYSPDLSATTMAQNSAQKAVAAFNGITLDSVTTSIIISPVDGSPITTQNSKLATAADPEKNVYQIEVAIAGKANPLIPLPGDTFAVIPGLTGPIALTTAAREAFENTQGLNK